MGKLFTAKSRFNPEAAFEDRRGKRMKSRYGQFTIAAVIGILLSVSCVSCGRTAGVDLMGTDPASGSPTGDANSGIAGNKSKDAGSLEDSTASQTTAVPEELSRLLLLKNGDTKQLVGLAFGDEIDYEAFDVSGYAKGTVMYRQKEPESDGLNFFFDGKRNGFSGLYTSWDGNFFGINLGEDTLKALIPVFGEPDTYEAGDDENEEYAVWHLKEADLTARIVEGKIRGLDYMAAEGAADGEEKPEALTDFGKDFRAGCDKAEAIYSWDAYGAVSGGSYAIYHPYDEGYDENQVGIFIKNYLSSQGITREKPDGISYNRQGDPFVEYYIDEGKNQYSFVVHLWADYWIDYEKGTSRYRDAVYCTTYTLDKADQVGSLIYNSDAERAVRRERLYDVQGKRMADISYEYIPGVPFPFLTDYWNLNMSYDLIGTVLCRNQKTWFYKEQSQFDQSGKLIRYNGSINDDDWKEYLTYPCTCVYSADGLLEAVEEEMQPEDTEKGWGWWDDSVDYSGQMKVSYKDNGMIDAVDYIRSSYTHGTTDSSGRIEYDEDGRMIYNSFYITHGTDIRIYLYEDGSERPWACFYWCSFAPGFENIYLFRPVSL